MCHSTQSSYINRRQQTEIYVYIYKSKNEIPVTVSFADIQYRSYKSFSFKYDVVLATKYISHKFLHHSILPEFIKTHNLYTTKSWFFAIKATCYIIGTTNQKVHLITSITRNRNRLA